MNLQNLNLDDVEAPRQWLPQFQSSEPFSDSEATIVPGAQQQPRRHRQQQQQPQSLGASLENGTAPKPSAAQQPQTTMAYQAPLRSSPPPSATELTPLELHRLQRRQQREQQRQQKQGGPSVRFDEAQLAMFASTQNTNLMSGLKDELTIAAGKVTPGVDDTPYIQYAIDALTRRKAGDDDGFSDGDFEQDMAGVRPPSRRMQDEESNVGYPPVAMPEPSYAGHRDIQREPSYNSREDLNREHNFAPHRQVHREPSSASLPPLTDDGMARTPSPASPVSWHAPTRQPEQRPTPPLPPISNRSDNDVWIPVTKEMRDNFYPNDVTYPPLTFKPGILRLFSMIFFTTLCLLMTAALIFCAVYSNSHDGMTPYNGSMYSGQYFVFRLLPQILGAVILVYAQGIMMASLRTLPFSALASEDARERYLALFRRLYPSTFLWPRLAGPWQLKSFSVATWLALFTIPLQSSAFTCIFVNGKWIWAPVQGVMWALLVFYLILAVTAGALTAFWVGKWTGLMWDVRSIGDLIPLLNRSNTTGGYQGKDMCESARNAKLQLRDRWFDRLGYWRTEDMQTGGLWYTIGSMGSDGAQDPQAIHELMGKRTSYNPSIDSHDLAVPMSVGQSRYRYLPWCLRDLPVTVFTATASALLLALLIVSFLPQTRLEAGFLPLLSAKPGGAAFSAANFLYSFLPSLLGMVLFLFFQSLDLPLRIVQPWADLSHPDGGIARKTILADYIACHPFQATWRALRVGHWRVAVISLLSVLSLAIPILAGGLFMALTNPASQVRMFPHIPVYGVLLAFLFLYVGALTTLLPRRAQFRLPHPVVCLADIISLCTAEELTQDAAFRSVRSREDLRTRLGAGSGADPREESVWFFGVVPGKDEKRLSVRRMRKFTEKVTMRRSFNGSMV